MPPGSAIASHSHRMLDPPARGRGPARTGKLERNCDENPRRIARLARWPPAGDMLDFPAPEIELSVMRRLILLRHAKSDWTGIGLQDRDRALARRCRDSPP